MLVNVIEVPVEIRYEFEFDDKIWIVCKLKLNGERDDGLRRFYKIMKNSDWNEKDEDREAIEDWFIEFKVKLGIYDSKVVGSGMVIVITWKVVLLALYLTEQTASIHTRLDEPRVLFSVITFTTSLFAKTIWFPIENLVLLIKLNALKSISSPISISITFL